MATKLRKEPFSLPLKRIKNNAIITNDDKAHQSLQTLMINVYRRCLPYSTKKAPQINGVLLQHMGLKKPLLFPTAS